MATRIRASIMRAFVESAAHDEKLPLHSQPPLSPNEEAERLQAEIDAAEAAEREDADREARQAEVTQILTSAHIEEEEDPNEHWATK
jgi:hypothetical protein